MKSKELFGKPFGYPVQLINLDIQYPLLPKADLEEALRTVAVFQHTENPMQTIYITPDLKAQGALGHGRKQNIAFCQKLTVTYIDGIRNKNFGGMLINRLYSSILDIESRGTLEEFLQFRPDFCDFPSQLERRGLFKKYPVNTTTSLEKIREVNLDFLFVKISEFQKFVRSWLEKDGSKEKMVESDLLWLNNELGKVSPIITGYGGRVWTGVRTEIKPPKAELSKVIGMGAANKAMPVYAYRVHGYFAFCCLELLHDMRNTVPVFVCERCGVLRAKKSGSTRKTCSRTDSVACKRRTDADRKQKNRTR